MNLSLLFGNHQQWNKDFDILVLVGVALGNHTRIVQTIGVASASPTGLAFDHSVG